MIYSLNESTDFMRKPLILSLFLYFYYLFFK